MLDLPRLVALEGGEEDCSSCRPGLLWLLL